MNARCASVEISWEESGMEGISLMRFVLEEIFWVETALEEIS
jgi:hypothetical protein